MSKRLLSPAPLPPPKRQHSVNFSPARGTVTSFDNALYDELVLFIFSFLGSSDLCAIQAASKNCSRLACDNQLWKTLFVRDFGKARLRGGKGFYGRTDGRLTKGLPSRASFPADDPKGLDWKWMYRISSNWRNGRCTVDSLGDSALITSPAQSLPPLTGAPQSRVLLAGALTIFASSEMSHQPVVLLRSRSGAVHALKCRSSTTTGPVGISAIAIDQSRPSSVTSKQDGLLRLAAFLSTGEFSIYEHGPSTFSPSPKLAYVPLPRYRGHVMHAAYHHPLLVTLSHTFTLMLYDLSGDTVIHTHSLSSFTSHPPTSLILSAIPSSTSYKLVLAYAIPVYPAHWSVGVTELIISSSGHVTPTAALSGTSRPTPLSANFTVTGTRSARAFDVPQGWIDDVKLKAMRAQWGRKVKRVADTQTDGKWVVLAPGDALGPPPSHDHGASSDASSSSSPSSYVSPLSHTSTQLQLYRLYMPSFSSSHAPRLSFVRTLHGPLGAVSALALADGRCVSLGVNGSIWVWDLEGGEGTEIAGPVVGFEQEGGGQGTVVFDERRIVTSGVRGMEERRFDI